MEIKSGEIVCYTFPTKLTIKMKTEYVVAETESFSAKNYFIENLLKAISGNPDYKIRLIHKYGAEFPEFLIEEKL